MWNFNKKKHSFKFLNATQFLGALNDNVFKLLIIYFIIHIQGIENASSILALAGAVFVIPFLLFSAAAGVLADRISKTKIIVAMKALELVLMSLGVVAVFFKSPISLYIILFFMAAQSAAFGPSKYGIIPEIVDPQKISKANGALNSLTYLAIIIGTFLASFLAKITNRNFILAMFSCIIIAFIGFLTSFGIIKTPAKRSKKKINPLFVYEIYKTLQICSKKRYLISSILGSAFFLFIGGFTQLNTIPLAIQSLNLTEIDGGFLFLTTAIGIAVGSVIAGKLSKDRVEPGMACLAGFFTVFVLLFLGLFAYSIITVIFLLIFLGFFGGLFLIPFDSFIQVFSPDKKRGRIIAATNFLSFCGVLFASFLLYLFSLVKISSASGFICVGILSLLFVTFITGRMSELFFSYVARKILLKFFRVNVTDIPTPSSYIILLNGSWLSIFLMFAFLPNLKIFTLGKVLKNFPYFRGFLNSLYLIKKRPNKSYCLKRLFAKTKKYKRRINYVCLSLDKRFQEKDVKNFLKTPYGTIFPPVTFLNITKKGKTISYEFKTTQS